MVSREEGLALTPLEYMAVADEVIYSALLRWLFGADSPLGLGARLRILERVAQVSLSGGTAISATTELKNIDLLVVVERPAGTVTIAFENKIKAEESQNQLANYDPHLMSAAKVFLTLTGEPPRSGEGWIALSYAQLRASLAQEVEPYADDPYLRDYLAMIGRLVWAADAVRNEPRIFAAHVFGDTNSLPPPPESARYVATLRLEKALQRIWLQSVARAAEAKLPNKLVKDWVVRVEGGKQALLNVETYAFDVGTLGMQCQYRKLKFFAHPAAYSKVVPTAVQKTRLLDVLMKLKPHLERLTKLGPGPDGWILDLAHGEAARSRCAMGPHPATVTATPTEAAW
ncbi:MAG TPA: PD-(D/E)XK nuclease family protein, partial [Polyangiaceae bacterium]